MGGGAPRARAVEMEEPSLPTYALDPDVANAASEPILHMVPEIFGLRVRWPSIEAVHDDIHVWVHPLSRDAQVSQQNYLVAFAQHFHGSDASRV